jgi:hypothetical protein
LIIEIGSAPISRGTPKATSRDTASRAISVVKNADRDCHPFGAPLAPKCVATTAGRTAANFRACSTPTNTRKTKIELGNLLLDPTGQFLLSLEIRTAFRSTDFSSIYRAFFGLAY